MDIPARHEKKLDAFIHTGKGDSNSPVIRWFRDELDPAFHYSTRNDIAFYTILQDEAGKVLWSDPSQKCCFWFALNEDKCISACLCPDDEDRDQLLMILEKKD